MSLRVAACGFLLGVGTGGLGVLSGVKAVARVDETTSHDGDGIAASCTNYEVLRARKLISKTMVGITSGSWTIAFLRTGGDIAAPQLNLP